MSTNSNRPNYITAIISALAYCYFETFHVRYGDHVSTMINTYNDLFRDIGDNRRYSTISLDEKIIYFIFILFCVIGASSLIALVFSFFQKQKNFGKLFTRSLVILSIILFICSCIELQNNKWYIINNPS